MENRLHTFNYYSDTNTANESLTQNQGNCLSLAIVTTALAMLANVDIGYQLVETEPVYQKEGDVILSSQHIQSVLFESRITQPGKFNISRNRMIIDYFPTYNSRVLRKVNDAEFRSMFYTNKATEEIIKENYHTAYWYLKKALELMLGDPNAINIMAVIHERAGFLDIAEQLYLFGIDNSVNEKKQLHQYLDIMNNYYFLLKRQNRESEATEISKKIDKHNILNPFKWINLGNTAYNNRDYKKAISYYKKASRIAPYLHESYAGIARSEFQLRNMKSTETSLKKAYKNSRESMRDLYQKKLELLKQLFDKKKPLRANNER